VRGKRLVRVHVTYTERSDDRNHTERLHRFVPRPIVVRLFVMLTTRDRHPVDHIAVA